MSFIIDKLLSSVKGNENIKEDTKLIKFSSLETFKDLY